MTGQTFALTWEQRGKLVAAYRQIRTACDALTLVMPGCGHDQPITEFCWDCP